MQLSILTSITGIVVLAYILELLRRQQLREKYAAIWLSIGVVIAPLGFFPDILDSTARRLGVASGVSLVLFAGFVLVLMVSLHLSWEASRLESETRTLAEDVALIRAHLAQQGTPLGSRPAATQAPALEAPALEDLAREDLEPKASS